MTYTFVPDVVLAQYKGVRKMRPHYTFRVDAKLYSLHGQAPYFSVTGEEVYNRHHVQAGGCMHDEVLRYFPKLAPVVRVHLSDEHGVPMHAVANALYHAGLSGYPDARNVQYLANHLRISVSLAEQIIAQCHSHPDVDAQAVMEAVVECLCPGWQAEADEAIEAMGGLS